MRGQSVMPGYYHLPEQTAEVMPDGKWFHTGDLGSIDRKGQLTITGRKKELTVTAGGKNVSPEVLEDSLATQPAESPTSSWSATSAPTSVPCSPSTQTCCPTGCPSTACRSARPPRPPSCPPFASPSRRPSSAPTRPSPRAESIRKIKVLTTDFTEANGLLTPSLKVKRLEATRRLASIIDEIYGGPVQN